MPDPPIRALVVDDERLARQALRLRLAAEPDIVQVGECADGPSAVEAVLALEPDVVFLDVQMPQMDGFQVLARLEPVAPLPRVVFVTAYDEYALRAFEVHALDYLLKPFDEERFQRMLRHVRTSLGDRGDGAARRIHALLDEREGGSRHARRLLVRDGGRVFFVKTGDILRIEAEGNYVRLHTPGRSHLMRTRMADLERTLDPSEFVRIHRSHIVNVEQIREVQPYFSGGHVVILHDGTRLGLSRSYRELLDRIAM